jgi:hypothetical protein
MLGAVPLSDFISLNIALDDLWARSFFAMVKFPDD